jgi:hypothetical protein
MKEFIIFRLLIEVIQKSIMWYKTFKVIRLCSVFLLVLSGFNGSAFAQDLLILNSGKELKVKIIEEGTDVIKYREFDNPSGPLYSVTKANVASIKYEKGSKVTQDTKVRGSEKTTSDISKQNTKLDLLTAKKYNVYIDGAVQAPRSVRLIMEDQPEALRLYESGRKLGRLSTSCAFGVMITSFIFTQSVNKKKTSEEKIKAGIPGLVIDGGLIIAAIIMSATGKSKIRSSVNLYNSAMNKPVSYKLDLGLQENGIGLALKF